VQPDQIVVGEVQGDRCLQVFQLLAESIGQSGKTPHAHPHGQVLSLNHASRDMHLLRGTLWLCGVGPLGYGGVQTVKLGQYRVPVRFALAQGFAYDSAGLERQAGAHGQTHPFPRRRSL
jgi:hypothetical protein